MELMRINGEMMTDVDDIVIDVNCGPNLCGSMNKVYVVDAVRTPIGKLGGGLSSIRPDDLLAHVIRVLLGRNASVDPGAIEDVIAGDANQAGEDNRNVARMAALLAGLPVTVAGNTVNRLCASGLQAGMDAARAIACGEGDLYIAGGVESMTRAPFVMGKATQAFSRQAEVFDSTIGWRFVNKRLAEKYHPYSMGETAENVARRWVVSRAEQDAFGLLSQEKYFAALDAGKWAAEIAPIDGLDKDEQPRHTSMEKLAALRPVARVVSMAVAGVDPAIMGVGPIPATHKALQRAGLSVGDLGLVELNEAFAVQALVCMRELGLDTSRVNVNGGSIAIGHPLGCSGVRISTTLLHEMGRREVKYGLATMCVGVGQGAAVIYEGV
jgi:acetyl-CoA acetyltransferase